MLVDVYDGVYASVDRCEPTPFPDVLWDD